MAACIYTMAALLIFLPLLVGKLIYLRENTVFLDGKVFSMVEIYKHWNTVETFVLYSGTKS
jgi:hypothetical protein